MAKVTPSAPSRVDQPMFASAGASIQKSSGSGSAGS